MECGIKVSFVVVEHNMQFLKMADWIIEMGPGAADSGGEVIATGTPEDLINDEKSLTGRYLKSAMQV